MDFRQKIIDFYGLKEEEYNESENYLNDIDRSELREHGFQFFPVLHTILV